MIEVLRHTNNYLLTIIGTIDPCLRMMWFKFTTGEGTDKKYFTYSYRTYEEVEKSIKKLVSGTYLW